MKKNLDKKENFISLDDKPKGTNNLSSRASFMQEKIYHQNSFSEIDFFINIKPLNFSYDTPFYGRINKEAISIIPKEDSIVQINNLKTPTYCLNFVKDAFDDFYDFWQLSKRRDFINEESELYNFSEISCYVNPVQLYTDFINDQYGSFIDFVNKNKFSKQIVDFKSFLKIFISFVDLKMPLIPFTFSSFCLSKFCDPKISGLIIDLSNEDKTNDSKKYDKFIKDPNYIFFYNAANTFGFNIDKKIPWRLIANTDSVAMKEYANKYNLQSDKIFETLYNKCHLGDIVLFKLITFKFYNKYTENNLMIVDQQIEKCKREKFVTKNKTIFREQNARTVSDQFWFRSYLFLRARENNLNWDQSKFNEVVQKTVQIAETLDIEQSMRYAEQHLNVKSDSSIKNNKFTL